MATLEPLTVAELESELSSWQGGLAARPSGEVQPRRSDLRALHDLLARASVAVGTPGEVVTARIAELVATAPDGAVAALAARPRTVLRLFRAGFPLVAWQVLADNAIGVVADSTRHSTATGAARPSARRPLRVLVESPTVFARLPGFRDPRHGVPDEVYDVTDQVVIQLRLDEIAVADGTLMLAGRAALDLVPCRADETVRLLVQGSEGQEPVATMGNRLRRADLVTGRGDGLTRRAWSGWAASVAIAALTPGEWSVGVELDHDGLRRHIELGADTTELALRAARAGQRSGRRILRWDTSRSQWRLVVEDTRLPWSMGKRRQRG